jgi:hypothetical protein
LRDLFETKQDTGIKNKNSRTYRDQKIY